MVTLIAPLVLLVLETVAHVLVGKEKHTIFNHHALYYCILKQMYTYVAASMLELARLTISSGWIPSRPIIFLFNGAEELFMLVSSDSTNLKLLLTIFSLVDDCFSSAFLLVAVFPFQIFVKTFLSCYTSTHTAYFIYDLYCV